MAEPLILINAFEVAGEEADQFVAAWEKPRDYLATQPGHVDTALHQAVTPGADFQFVNIGRWQSAEDFLAATQSPVRPCRPLANVLLLDYLTPEDAPRCRTWPPPKGYTGGVSEPGEKP